MYETIWMHPGRCERRAARRAHAFARRMARMHRWSGYAYGDAGRGAAWAARRELRRFWVFFALVELWRALWPAAARSRTASAAWKKRALRRRRMSPRAASAAGGYARS